MKKHLIVHLIVLPFLFLISGCSSGNPFGKGILFGWITTILFAIAVLGGLITMFSKNKIDAPAAVGFIALITTLLLVA
ncbi:MAG: hypothetical protein WC091_22630 [Sulfuricellaceae bacterium]